MPAPPAHTTTRDSSNKLASWTWYLFKLGFGLFSLTFTWITISYKNGFFLKNDTDEEKQELIAGNTHSGYRHYTADSAQPKRNTGALIANLFLASSMLSSQPRQGQTFTMSSMRRPMPLPHRMLLSSSMGSLIRICCGNISFKRQHCNSPTP